MRVRLLFSAALVCLPVVPALAQSEGRVVEIVDLRGPLDERTMEFAISSVEAAARGDVEVVVLQLDSPGVLGSRQTLERLMAVVSEPPLPLAVWIGPDPAVAHGGALQLAEAAPFTGAAPGARLGFGVPTLIGRERFEGPVADLAGFLQTGVVEVGGPADLGGVIDVVQPSLRQFVTVDLHGRTFVVGGEQVAVSTVIQLDDVGEQVTNLPTVIREPNAWDQFLGLASRPEAAFFFLVAGLTVAAFEFYAIGPGIAAGVAAISLLLGAHGVAVLPVRWWSLLVTVGSIILLAVAYQLGGVAVLTGAGIVGLTLGGLWFTDAAPQMSPSVGGVLLTVAAAGFFFILAMPTVARARFSTHRIGRDGMIGRRGSATTVLDPDGEVEVDGALWRATSHRAAGIESGDEVVVTGVDGWYLEVDPVVPRENRR